jgi:hypothetical protein
MAAPINQFSFSSGEISPQLWDRVDVDKYHSGAALLRNFFVDYRGGASNRPGTKYCLQCLDSTQPSRLIPFAFSTLQTYALCFGAGPTVTGTVTGTANNGSGAIRLAVNSTAGLMSGNRMTVTGVHDSGGLLDNANGTWPIQVIDSTHVDLIGSTYGNLYMSGGTTSTPTGRMRVFTNGAAVLNGPIDFGATAITNASPGVVTYSNPTGGPDPANGDWIYFFIAPGMPRLVNRFAVVTNVNTVAMTFQLYDLFGAPIDTTNYGTLSSQGAFQTVYTLPVPYAATDLAQLKFTQSADVMTLTHTLYQQAQLTRTADNAWTYTQIAFKPSTPTVTGVTVTHQNQGAGTQYSSTAYLYSVTAIVNNVEGEAGSGSIAAVPAMSQNLGSQNTVSWTAVTGATGYKIYRTQENLNQGIVAGAMVGYVGSATGTSFIDENITPNFSRAPPQGNNPFAGADWPGCTTYFQGRQAYAGTANEPSRLVLSKSGDYSNMDFSNPTQPGDMIDVTLNSNQVNAIQHLIPLQVLLAFTSSTVFRIDTGDTAQAMTPSNVMARPQNSDGCSNVPPVVIDYEILFVQNLQSTVRALKYDFLMNLFRGDNELTLFANHLVFNHKIVEWAWAQQPFRVLWCVRDDGVLLSLTYLPNQNLQAWAQHDTQGQVLSICTVVEGSENVIYMVVRRYVRGQYVNYVERMASRVFGDITQAWFVDAGLQYPQVYPAATAYPAATEGNSTLAAAANVVYGGSGYSAQTTAQVIDAGATEGNAGGSGSTVTLTIVGGVITAAACTAGSGWIRPQIVVTDPGGGSGAVITPIVQELVTVTASSAVFNPATDVGTVMRINGGVGTVVSVQSTTQVTLNVTQALTNTNPALAGAWSYTMPVSSVSGLDHLEGQTVAILADGGVQPQQVVHNGAVTLTEPADAIVVGLPYTSEIQSLYLDIPGQEEPTVQGKRKKISRVILRVANSRGLMVGPLGQTLYEVKDRTVSTPMGQPQPLFTGDYLINLDPNFNEQAQIDMVQSDPLPVTVLGFMPWLTLGDG